MQKEYLLAQMAVALLLMTSCASAPITEISAKKPEPMSVDAWNRMHQRAAAPKHRFSFFKSMIRQANLALRGHYSVICHFDQI